VVLCRNSAASAMSFLNDEAEFMVAKPQKIGGMSYASHGFADFVYRTSIRPL
jgi:hypothetical protein